MNNNNNNSILLIVFIFSMTLGLLYFGGNVFKNKIIKQIREELKRDYAPGPYSPGFDPDKINPTIIQHTLPDLGRPSDMPSPQDWNKTWESQRFNSK